GCEAAVQHDGPRAGGEGDVDGGPCAVPQVGRRVDAVAGARAAVVRDEVEVAGVVQLEDAHRGAGGGELADGDRGERLPVQRRVHPVEIRVERVRVRVPGPAACQAGVEPALEGDPAGQAGECRVVADEVPA